MNSQDASPMDLRYRYDIDIDDIFPFLDDEKTQDLVNLLYDMTLSQSQETEDWHPEETEDSDPDFVVETFRSPPIPQNIPTKERKRPWSSPFARLPAEISNILRMESKEANSSGNKNHDENAFLRLPEEASTALSDHLKNLGPISSNTQDSLWSLKIDSLVKLRRFLIVHKPQITNFINSHSNKKLESSLSHDDFLRECIWYINSELGFDLGEYVPKGIEKRYWDELKAKIQDTFHEILLYRVSDRNLKKVLQQGNIKYAPEFKEIEKMVVNNAVSTKVQIFLAKVLNSSIPVDFKKLAQRIPSLREEDTRMPVDRFVQSVNFSG